MACPTVRARGSTSHTVLVFVTTFMTLLVPTGRIITSFAKSLLARAVAAVSRRTRYACRACHCRAARCVRTDHACRALFRRVLRVLVVAATLVALRLAAIGVITRQTTRSLRAAIARVTLGAGMARVIFRQEVCGVARAAMVRHRALRLLH